MKYLKHFKVFENKKFCSECGSELELKTRFCGECGTKQDMLNRPKSDDEKSVLVKLDDDKMDLKEKIGLIISTYEGDLIQHHDFDKKVLDVIGEYQKKFGYDDFWEKALKLCKKSNLIGTIEIYKAKSQDPEYRKTLDSLIDEFHDKDVDDYDSTSMMMKALLLDTVNSSLKRENRRPWKDQYFNLIKDFKKDDASEIFGQIIALDMMITVAHKYPKHKADFDKIYQEYLKNGISSELLKKTYAKEYEIKKQPNGSKIRFDSSGKEIK